MLRYQEQAAAKQAAADAACDGAPKFKAYPHAHFVEEKRSPISVIAACDCGWRRQFSRRQNALARTAKVRAAIRRHLEAIS